jgi:hypothetical protein
VVPLKATLHGLVSVHARLNDTHTPLLSDHLLQYMEAELDAEVESPNMQDVEEPLPDAVREIFEQFDPLAFHLVEFATDSSCNDQVDQYTRYQIETFFMWMTRILSYFNCNWDKKTELCPVLGLLAILEVSGLEKGKTWETLLSLVVGNL